MLAFEYAHHCLVLFEVDVADGTIICIFVIKLIICFFIEERFKFLNFFRSEALKFFCVFLCFLLFVFKKVLVYFVLCTDIISLPPARHNTPYIFSLLLPSIDKFELAFDLSSEHLVSCRDTFGYHVFLSRDKASLVYNTQHLLQLF